MSSKTLSSLVRKLVNKIRQALEEGVIEQEMLAALVGLPLVAKIGLPLFELSKYQQGLTSGQNRHVMLG